MSTINIEILRTESYLQSIKNSVGSKLFRNFYAKVDGKKKDILENGKVSCANFVSSILYLNKLCKDVHATVSGTVKDMESHGWTKIATPRPGAVIVWGMSKINGELHKHIGFSLDKDKVISNSTSKRTPTIHHWTFGQKNKKPVKNIEAIYWNETLNK